MRVNDRGRLYFAYSRHMSRERAEAALGDYFAEGSICEAEAPWIMRERSKGRYVWCVMFPAE